MTDEYYDKYQARCSFPKHSGRLWIDVVDDDRPYVEWLIWDFLGGDANETLVDFLTDLLEESYE